MLLFAYYMNALMVDYVFSADCLFTIFPNSGENCSVQINTSSRGGILRLNITSFDLGGRDPCSSTQEHLMIVFCKPHDFDTVNLCLGLNALISGEPDELALFKFPVSLMSWPCLPWN